MGIFGGRRMEPGPAGPGSIEELMAGAPGYDVGVGGGWTPPPGGPQSGLVGGPLSGMGGGFGGQLFGGIGRRTNNGAPIGQPYVENPGYGEYMLNDLNSGGPGGQQAMMNAPQQYMPVQGFPNGSAGSFGQGLGDRGGLDPYPGGYPDDWRTQEPSSGREARWWESQAFNQQGSPWNWPTMEGWNGQVYNPGIENMSGFGQGFHPFGNSYTAAQALNPNPPGQYLGALAGLSPALGAIGEAAGLPSELTGAVGGILGGAMNLPYFQPYRF